MNLKQTVYAIAALEYISQKFHHANIVIRIILGQRPLTASIAVKPSKPY